MLSLAARGTASRHTPANDLSRRPIPSAVAAPSSSPLRGPRRARPSTLVASHLRRAMRHPSHWLGPQDSARRRVARASSGEVPSASAGSPASPAESEPAGAERAAKALPAFSFSASGLMFVYYIGVVAKLQEAGALTDTTHIAGSSGGAVMSALVACGVTTAVVTQEVKALYRDLHLHTRMWSFFPRLEGHLRPMLQRVLPEDAHLRVRERCSIQVSQMWPLRRDPALEGRLFPWRPFGRLMDRFESKEELIDAMIATTYLPGPLFLPALALAAVTATAAAFYFAYAGKWLLGCGLLASAAGVVVGLLHGKLSLLTAAVRGTGCWDGAITTRIPDGRVHVTAFHSETDVCKDLRKELEAKGADFAIYPDCIPPVNPAMTYTPEQWFRWVFNVPTADEIDMIIDTGYQGAAKWLNRRNSKEQLDERASIDTSVPVMD